MYTRFNLKNGLRVVIENIPHVRSVTIGVWVSAGSKNETIKNNGISHFIEHMLFKGTYNRTAKEIADSMDSIGGQLNAFTSKECTCYYAKVLDDKFEYAVDVLSDMLFNSKFDQSDIDKERKVVIEEINMYEDSPEETVHDQIGSILFGEHPLSYPILGTEEILNNIGREEILSYIEQRYTANNAVISIAGNIKEEKAIEILEEYFGNWKTNDLIEDKIEEPKVDINIQVKKKSTEQVHMCIGMEGLKQGHKDMYTLLVLNNILGGSMSSRLFQNIREDKGLVYSVYSYPSFYKEGGMFCIYAGMNIKEFDTVLKLIRKEIDDMIEKGVTKEEVLKSKEQMKGSYILGLESTSSRMTSLGKSELITGRIKTQQEILEYIDSVKLEDVNAKAKEMFESRSMSLSVIGDFESEEETAEQIKNILLSK